MMSPEHGTAEDLICIFAYNNVPAEVSNILVHELRAYETLRNFVYSEESELNSLCTQYFEESKLPKEELHSQWPLVITNHLIYLHRWLLNYIAKYRRFQTSGNCLQSNLLFYPVKYLIWKRKK